MTDNQIIEKTVRFVKETLIDAEGGHDWFHIERVFRNSTMIAKEENVDSLTVALAALLHDIADAKFYGGDETVGPKMANAFLDQLPVAKEITAHVIKIIENISFKNTLIKNEGIQFSSLELQVVQDADRLDAIGAIGIARAFNYGGYKNREIHNPDCAPKLNLTKEEYKTSKAPTINHFYEKLLLLKDKMNTVTGKKLAEARHQYMLDYLDQFHKEWNGQV
ncbi:MAG: HD domain-containing protein [Flavobacteriaceae bacterium]